MQAQQATGPAFSVRQSASVALPVANALTAALNQLTVTTPTLRNDQLLSQITQSLSNGLTTDLTAFKNTVGLVSFSQIPSGSAALNSAEASYAEAQARGSYNVDVASTNSALGHGAAAARDADTEKKVNATTQPGGKSQHVEPRWLMTPPLVVEPA
jgi:hypothetical protein